MSTGFVICSRRNSSRVPNKAFHQYNGKTHIEHLVERLLKTDIPVYVAVPEDEVHIYAFLMDKFPKRVFISGGFADDPLRRMYGVAKEFSLDKIIRVTHDKIFVDEGQVFQMLGVFNKNALDYAYSSTMVAGTGFEIISFKALELAALAYKRVEHISYAIKAVTSNQQDVFSTNSQLHSGIRLLVDYPEDVQLMNLIFASLGTNCTQDQVLEFLLENDWAMSINKLPEVSVYTCAYNAEKWIDAAMGSVGSQTNFGSMEYILIDDCSSDATALKMAKFCSVYSPARWYRNPSNIGLASSSNKALNKARGKYIMRLDADDVLASPSSISELVHEASTRSLDAVYPNAYLGFSRNEVQQGSLNHHVGGSLFKTSAVNHVRFTEGLRNYEGLDFFTRARSQIKIGYLNKPTFIYRQHEGSMSKNNLDERLLVKRAILGEAHEA